VEKKNIRKGETIMRHLKLTRRRLRRTMWHRVVW